MDAFLLLRIERDALRFSWDELVLQYYRLITARDTCYSFQVSFAAAQHPWAASYARQMRLLIGG